MSMFLPCPVRRARPGFCDHGPNDQNLRPSFTNPFNLTGLPALYIPAALRKEICPPNFRSSLHVRGGDLLYEQAADCTGDDLLFDSRQERGEFAQPHTICFEGSFRKAISLLLGEH